MLFLFLTGLTAVAARRQRDTSGGRLQATQAAAVGGKVGGDVCPQEVCSHAEDTRNCSIWSRSGEERRSCGRLWVASGKVLYDDGGERSCGATLALTTH